MSLAESIGQKSTSCFSQASEASREKWRFLFQLIYLFIFLKRGVDICAQIFTAALFTVAKTRKQPKCLSADKYIKKMWCICIQ